MIYIIYDYFKDNKSIISSFENSGFYNFDDIQPILKQKIKLNEIEKLIENYNNTLYDIIKNSDNKNHTISNKNL